jgi:hypothetical protein
MRIGADCCGFSEVLLRFEGRLADSINQMSSHAIKSDSYFARYDARSSSKKARSTAFVAVGMHHGLLAP